MTEAGGLLPPGTANLTANPGLLFAFPLATVIAPDAHLLNGTYDTPLDVPLPYVTQRRSVPYST